MTVPQQVSEKEFADICEKLILQHIRENERINDETTHLRIIDCGRSYGDEKVPDHWNIFVAVLSNQGSDGCYLHFAGYHADICLERYDPGKPITEQLQIGKDDKPMLDLYFKTGHIEKDIRPVRALRALADEIETKYLIGSAHYGNKLPPRS